MRKSLLLPSPRIDRDPPTRTTRPLGTFALGALSAALSLGLGLAGCGSGGGMARDGGPFDLARPDLTQSAVDLAAPDLAPPPDLVTLDLTAPAGSPAIAAVRAWADAPPDGGTPNLPVSGVYVTYAKALVGTDVAGFFVQAEKTGPALFVAVDPNTLSPSPRPGDVVSFTVTAAGKNGSLRQATAITGYSRTATGKNAEVAALVQDVTAAADLVSAVDTYESELISLAGTLSGPIGGAGAGFVSAQLDTAAVQANPQLKLRLPVTVRDAVDLTAGCKLNLNAAPLWRFNTQAQPSAWSTTDLSISSCPAPQVTAAAATTPGTVIVSFDRNIDPKTVAGDGSQFSFSGNLGSISAVASGNKVTVTTSAHAGGQSYTVTVAATVKDLRGTGVDAAKNSATFLGFLVPATLMVNEVNPNIAAGLDLVELLVTRAGNVNGFVLQNDVGSPATLATLPNLNVAQGDIILVHLTPPMTLTTETSGKAACTDPTCVASAWDVAGAAQGISFSHHILIVKAPDGSFQDAVPFGRMTGLSTPPSAFPGDLQSIQGMNLWTPKDCGGAPCTYTSTPTAPAVAADWTTIETAATGKSVRRTAGANTKSAADWTIGASSWGLPNP